jgi:hypothetical protein
MPSNPLILQGKTETQVGGELVQSLAVDSKAEI